MDKVNEEAVRLLEKYRSDGYIVLVPNLRHIKDIQFGYRLFLQEVPVSPDPANRQVYPHESKQYDEYQGKWRTETKGAKGKTYPVDMAKVRVRLSGQTLEELAKEANIQWESPLLVPQQNQNQELCYIAGSITLPDGLTLYRWPDVKGIDLDLERQRIIDKYTDDETGTVPANKQFLVERDFQQKKANQKANCISGARNRVIRKLLGVEQSYLISALTKPIIVPSIIQWLDMSDPETRALFVKTRILQSSAQKLFGPGPGDQQRMIEHQSGNLPPVDRSAFEDDDRDGSVIDTQEADPAGPPEEKKHYKVEKDPLPPEAEPEPEKGKPEKTADELRLDFENCDCETKCASLNRMAVELKLTDWLADYLEKSKKPLVKISDKGKLAIYDYFCKKGGQP